MKRNTELCFSVPIHIVDPDTDTATILLSETEAIANLYRQSPLSNPWSGNIRTTFNFDQENNIILNECPALYSFILESLEHWLADLAVTPRYASVTLYDSWINYASTGMYQEYHIHPYSDISGVFYVEAPTGCGDIQFSSPSSVYNYAEICHRSKFLTPNVKYSPVKGRLIFFPSWLSHCTLPNTSSEDRISISFNIKLGI